MNLEYNGTIPVPVDAAWSVLSDLERVAACLPGVRLDQINGDEVAGTVTMPLGPLRLTYRGEAAFVERDPAARRVVIDAAGRDSHGEQAASARVTVQLRPEGDGTHVAALAEVNVRGMSPPVGFAVREFGTGLLREFVGRLGAHRAARTPEPAAETAGAAAGSSAGASGEGAVAGGIPAGGSGAAPSGRRPARAPAATAASRRVPEPRPQSSPRLTVARGPEDAIYPVPPPGSGPVVPPAVAQLAPYAGVLAVGVLLGWIAGRRSRR